MKSQKLKNLLLWWDSVANVAYIKTKTKKLASSFWTDLKKGSLKNVLSLSGISKLLFLYFMIVFYIILFTFEFSPTLFSNKNAQKVAIYSVKGRIGEHRLYERTLKALRNMGIEYVGCSFDEGAITDKWTSHLYIAAASIVNMLIKPEFNLALTHYVKILPTGYNLTYLNMPDLNLYSLGHKFKSEYPHLGKYDAYIDIASIIDGKNPLLSSVLKNIDREDALVIPAYLSHDMREFMAPEEYKAAVITGSLWGCNRGSFRFKDAIHLLADEKLLIAYGLADAFDYLGDGYKGEMEKYGDPDEQLLTLQRNEGISLIVHNFEHLVQGVPTSRIAEGIMSGAIVISDDHPFIRKYFGDNVLYFDSFKDRDTIYAQIKTHIEWIKSHPQDTQIMSKNAYDIFVKDWVMEKQLQKIMQAVRERKG